MSRKIIKVGFDLDGILLYNPTRIARPIIAFLKKYFLKRDLKRFYYPKTALEKFIWLILHKTSLWPAPGINNLKKLIKKGKIKAYVISARYESLEKDFKRWQKKIDPENIFSGWFYNKKNDQPHLYKQKMIEKLKLNIFVEDNWDIVDYLKKSQNKCQIFWLYNLFDRKINYSNKFPTLKRILSKISRL